MIYIISYEHKMKINMAKKYLPPGVLNFLATIVEKIKVKGKRKVS